MAAESVPPFVTLQKKKENVKNNLSSVKHKIGIYSAKGGVGKTTISVNLAYALKEKGFKVGLLDADIDCPNVTMFLGMNDRITEMPLKPIDKLGVKVLSTAMLTDDASQPIIWRGPLIAKMVDDFLGNAEWGALDYLIIDLPPGTSDAPLSIMQMLDLDGFILVTTPQKISAINTMRSGNMALKLGNGILGVIENMSAGNSENAKKLAEQLHTKFLGSIPYEASFAEFSDSGKVPVLESNSIKAAFDAIISNIIGNS